MQPQAYDELDPDEALDLVERLEKIQIDRDEMLIKYFAMQFELTQRIIAAGAGVTLPASFGDSGGGGNDRGDEWR